MMPTCSGGASATHQHSHTGSKRAQKYTLPDYVIIENFAAKLAQLVATPNIMTEVDSIMRQLPLADYEPISEIVRDLARNRIEIYIPTREIADSRIHSTSGLADLAIMILSETYLVVPNDFPLSNRIAGLGPRCRAHQPLTRVDAALSSRCDRLPQQASVAIRVADDTALAIEHHCRALLRRVGGPARQARVFRIAG